MTATCVGDERGVDGVQLLAVFADGVHRTYASGPPPHVGPALAEVLAAGTRTAPADGAVPTAASERARPRLLGRLRGRRPRLALGAAAASLTFLGVGAAGALPGPAQSVFDRSADAVGVPLPAAGARDWRAPDSDHLDELPARHSSGPHDEGGAGAGEDAGPTVPVPPAGDRQRAVVDPEHPAPADASQPARAAPRDVDVPSGGAGERPRQSGTERAAAEDRPAAVPERSDRPQASGSAPSGVGAGAATGPEDGPGVGPRRPTWHRPSRGLAQDEATGPAGSGLGWESGGSAGAPAERAYPSGPSRR